MWLNTVLEDHPYECPICKVDDMKEYVETPCGHKYCQECIKSWMKKNNSCPYCRAGLPKVSVSGDDIISRIRALTLSE